MNFGQITFAAACSWNSGDKVPATRRTAGVRPGACSLRSDVFEFASPATHQTEEARVSFPPASIRDRADARPYLTPRRWLASATAPEVAGVTHPDGAELHGTWRAGGAGSFFGRSPPDRELALGEAEVTGETVMRVASEKGAGMAPKRRSEWQQFTAPTRSDDFAERKRQKQIHFPTTAKTWRGADSWAGAGHQRTKTTTQPLPSFEMTSVV